MLYQVEGAAAYCYTGGKAFDAALPCAVFIHGAQNDHSVWALQTRYFAHHGFNVLALDLPGHSRSKGAARHSVEALAQWLLALLDAAGIARASLIGHSMGALIALEAARQALERVSHLALLGLSYPMPVSPALLARATTDTTGAIALVNRWSHSRHQKAFPGPGFSTLGCSQQLMQRIASSSTQPILHTDFFACDAYANGAIAAASVTCPTLFIFGKRDLMTPVKSTRLLTGAIPHGQVLQLDCGHAVMTEQADAVLDALFEFALNGGLGN